MLRDNSKGRLNIKLIPLSCSKLEEEVLITEPQGKEDKGDWEDEEDLPPVKWFERELRRLLRYGSTT